MGASVEDKAVVLVAPRRFVEGCFRGVVKYT